MHGTADSLAERFSRLAQETPDRRRVDLELRTLDLLLSAVNQFATGAPQADDITVLVFRYRGALS